MTIAFGYPNLRGLALRALFCYDYFIIKRSQMNEFVTRAAALFATAAVFAVVLPIALKVLFTVGPFGFVALIFVFFAVASVFSS